MKVNYVTYLLAGMLLFSGVDSLAGGRVRPAQHQKTEDVNMNEDRNREIIRRFYAEILNRKNLEQVEVFISQDYTGNSGAGISHGPEGFARSIGMIMNTLPDVQWKIEDMIGEGNKVVVRQSLIGTHTGDFNGLPATGKKISDSGIVIFRLENHRIVESWIQTDRLGFLQQMGVVPENPFPPGKTGFPAQPVFIDRFSVPVNAREEFMQRMNINRNFLRTVPGFVKDAAYESDDGNGSFTIVTVAVWETEDALKNAKELVRMRYREEGFDLQEMFRRLNITMDQGTFTEVQLQP